MKRTAEAEPLTAGAGQFLRGGDRADDPRSAKVATLSGAEQVKDGWVLEPPRNFQAPDDGNAESDAVQAGSDEKPAPRSLGWRQSFKGVLSDGMVTMIVAHAMDGAGHAKDLESAERRTSM